MGASGYDALTSLGSVTDSNDSRKATTRIVDEEIGLKDMQQALTHHGLDRKKPAQCKRCSGNGRKQVMLII